MQTRSVRFPPVFIQRDKGCELGFWCFDWRQRGDGPLPQTSFLQVSQSVIFFSGKLLYGKVQGRIETRVLFFFFVPHFSWSRGYHVANYCCRWAVTCDITALMKVERSPREGTIEREVVNSLDNSGWTLAAVASLQCWQLRATHMNIIFCLNWP